MPIEHCHSIPSKIIQLHEMCGVLVGRIGRILYNAQSVLEPVPDLLQVLFGLCTLEQAPVGFLDKERGGKRHG